MLDATCFIDSMRSGLSWLPQRLERSWLGVATGVVALVILGALLDPLFFAFGYVGVASRVFALYRLICGQVPSHSYYIMGYQLALCSRNLAIYGSLLAGCLLFRWIEARIPPLDWKLWLLTMAPMALDGGTQLFGLRESNWALRTLTGVIFGLGVCWYMLPQLRDAARPGAPDSAYSSAERR